MKVNADEAIEIINIVISSSISGSRVVSVSHSIGSSFILRIGNVAQASQEGDQFEWRIDVLSAAWNIYVRGKKYSSSTEGDNWILYSDALVGGEISDLSIASNGTLRVDFGDEMSSIEVFEDLNQEDGVSNWMISYWEQWLLTEKNRQGYEFESLREDKKARLLS